MEFLSSRGVFFGATCLDIVLSVPLYPTEDAEVRINSIERATGGNATNSACVCAQLCSHLAVASVPPVVELVSVVPDPLRDDDTRWTVASLSSSGVGTSFLSVLAQSSGLPVSYIALTPGSRTIFHSRGIPEMDALTAEKTALALCTGSRAPGLIQWLHFEGRAVDATAAAMRRALASEAPSVISLELEKARADGDLETALVPLADIIFVGREYATSVLHCADASAALSALAEKSRTHALLVATWGAEGVFARADWAGPTVMHVSAHHPDGGVIDTIGAGDSFVGAAVAWALLRPASKWLRLLIASRVQSRPDVLSAAGMQDYRLELRAWLSFACLVAGLKCGQKGLSLSIAALTRIAELQPSAPSIASVTPPGEPLS